MVAPPPAPAGAGTPTAGRGGACGAAQHPAVAQAQGQIRKHMVTGYLRLKRKGYLTGSTRRATMEASMADDKEVEVEARVEHTTEKAWLIIDTMSGKQAWLPKSQGRIVQEVDPDGNTLFMVTDWWYSKKSGFA